MLDHIAFAVSDLPRSVAFYEQTLAPLGMKVLVGRAGKLAGFGDDGKPFFFIRTYGPVVQGGLHAAFTVDERGTVDAFHAAGLAAGGTDNGGPGVREIYHPDYYTAFVLDLDGNNIEAVCHKPA